MLTRETFTGPWAGLPVAWTEEDTFDESAYRACVARCCEAGIPGVYCGGTTGEFYALELDEFRAVARATVEECHAHDTPAMVSCTATSTRGAAIRAAYAAELGADAVQCALPFWMELQDDEVVPFFVTVSDACGGLPFSIYETLRTKKALSLDLHKAVKEAVSNYLMVKANSGTLGAEPDGCRELSEFVNVFVNESMWADLGPCGIRGCCSAMVYWNPRIILALWALVQGGQWDALREAAQPLGELHGFLMSHCAPKGFTDTAYDHMGAVATGFLPMAVRSRGPYRSATDVDVAEFRAWCAENYPEFLEL
ncbi:MAG: dihydrodipicolinate synthase family protein [bacterium]|nr:dihydrodipicolinate synthase family protein [bacterium]